MSSPLTLSVSIFACKRQLFSNAAVTTMQRGLAAPRKEPIFLSLSTSNFCPARSAVAAVVVVVMTTGTSELTSASFALLSCFHCRHDLVIRGSLYRCKIDLLHKSLFSSVSYCSETAPPAPSLVGVEELPAPSSRDALFPKVIGLI